MIDMDVAYSFNQLAPPFKPTVTTGSTRACRAPLQPSGLITIAEAVMSQAYLANFPPCRPALYYPPNSTFL